MLKINPFIKSPEGLGLILLIFFHAVASYFSFGFHHPDEHFQILEFANYWIGLVPDASKLPWEFAAQIRPWFQPMLHGSVMRAALLLDVYNPFTLAFLFRLMYSALNIWGMWLLWLEFKKRFHLNPLWFLWISLIWFFPYIHVRTSSENLAGIFLTFAFVAFLRNQKLFWIGLLFGFSFLARYQVALGIFGFGIYLLYRDRKITKDQFGLLLGFLIPVGLGVLLDRIGYGNWVFTPYRYFKVNLVDGVAATFNPYPWYQYFIWIFQLNPLVSLPLFIGTIFYAKRVRFDALSAFVWSFFILHLFITNKEYRFLFPILNLVPFLAVIGFQEFSNLVLTKRNLAVYSFINLIGFSVSSLHGASVETLWCVTVANRYAEPGETWLSNRDYLDQFSKGYYQLKDHHLILFHDGPELANLLDTRPDSKVLIDGQLRDASTQSELAVLEQRHCSVLTSARPGFLFKLRTQFPGIDRLAFKAVYRCKAEDAKLLSP
jgi:phosphatidylinositol glycan class B